MAQEKKINKKRRDLISFVLLLTIIVLINFISSFYFKRFDLTEEKRYTISAQTKDMLKHLDDAVYFKIYLDGKLNADNNHLRNATREMLDEFRAYSPNIEYEFINPSSNPDKKQRESLYKQLVEKGITPKNQETGMENGVSEQIIFPGSIVSCKGREMTVQLLKDQKGLSPEQQINGSIEALEYELTNVIRKLRMQSKPKIAFIDGQYELDSLHTVDITASLFEYYQVERVKIGNNIHALIDTLNKAPSILKYKAIIIAKPDSGFSDKAKLLIDQYIMYGGKVLWLVNPVTTNMDSLKRNTFTFAIPSQLRLEDMLFTYGVRINPNLLMDMQCARIPLNVAYNKGEPKFKFMPFVFFPLIGPAPNDNNPIIKNLDLIEFRFVSSIDTISAKGIKKTVLLRSSSHTRITNTPTRVSTSVAYMPPDERQFHNFYQPVAVLLEGAFTSVYKDHVPTAIKQSREFGYRENGVNTKMIVISSGDIIANEISRGQVVPLGYDLYMNQLFGNKNFILNCVNYLCDDSGLISVRSREIKLRMMDRKKIKNEESQWKALNMTVPVALVLLFGLIRYYLRKKKYTS
ncbi:MAG: gliding motility-associated ABC transporter substrate-binding protein GldG [Bacteroidia bacterium]